MGDTQQTKPVTSQQPSPSKELVKKQDLHFRKMLHRKVRFDDEPVSKQDKGELSKKLKEQGKSDKKSLHDQKRQAKYQPAYDTRLEILDRAVVYLGQMSPFTDKARDELLKMRKEAEELAKKSPPDWKGAVGKLIEEKIAKAEYEARLQANTREKDRSKDEILGPAMLEVARLREKFNSSVLSNAVSNKVAGIMNKQYSILLWGKETREESTSKSVKQRIAQAALKDVAESEKLIDEDVKKTNAEYKKYKNRSDMFIGIKALEKLGPGYLGDFGDGELADLQRRKEAADSDAAFGDYETAHKRLDELAEECERLLSEAKSAKNARSEDLKQAQQGVPPALDQLDKLIEDKATPGPLLEQAKTVRAQLGKLATIDDDNETANLEQIRQLMADAEDVLERAETGPDFAKRKGKLIKEVEVKKQWVDASIDVLESELKRHDEIGADVREEALAPLRKELLQIDGAWVKRAKVAFDFVSLDQDGALEAFYGLRDKVLAAGSPGAIEALSNKKALDAARGKLAEQIKSTESVLDVAIGVVPEIGVTLAGDVEKARALLATNTNPKKLDEVRGALSTQAEKLRKLVSKGEAKIKDDHKTITDLIAGADKILLELREKIGDKPASNERRKAYEPMLATLQQASVTLKKLADTNDSALLDETLADAVKLKSDAEKMKAGWSKETDDDDPNTFNYVRKQLQEVEKTFNDFKDVDYVMISHDAISDQIEAAKKALGTEDPPKTLDKVKEIEAAIKTMKEKAKTGKEHYEEIKKLCEKTKSVFASGMLSGKTVFEEHGPELVKELDSELNVLQANGKFEDGYKQAKADIGAMSKRLETMLKSDKNMAGIPAMIYDGQQKAKQTAEKTELQKKQYDGEVKALHTELEHAKVSGTPAKEVDKLKKEVAFLTKQVAGKQKDYAGALQRVGQIRTVVAGFSEAPQGLKITARNNLAPTNKAYIRASRRFARQLTGLAETLAKFDLTDDKNKDNTERLGVINRELTSVAAMFNPLTFQAVIKKMIAYSDPKDMGPKRKAREKGLRAARRMMKRMHKDQRLRFLIKNPFDPKIKKTLSQLNLALLDLEHNMLVSV